MIKKLRNCWLCSAHSNAPPNLRPLFERKLFPDQLRQRKATNEASETKGSQIKLCHQSTILSKQKQTLYWESSWESSWGLQTTTV